MTDLTGDVEENLSANDKPLPIRTERHFRHKNEVRVRAGLVWTLVLAYLAFLAVGAVLVTASDKPLDNYYHFLEVALPTLTGFVGAALGFYFGKNQSE